MTELITFNIVEQPVTFNVGEQPVIFDIGEGIPLFISGTLNNYEELLIGAINNDNVLFETTFDYVANTTEIFKNGLRQRNGINYTELGDKGIEFETAPLNYGIDDELLIIYTKV